jgi:hypothetical protein
LCAEHNQLVAGVGTTEKREEEYREKVDHNSFANSSRVATKNNGCDRDSEIRGQV